jgi:hypothetical protein
LNNNNNNPGFNNNPSTNLLQYTNRSLGFSIGYTNGSIVEKYSNGVGFTAMRNSSGMPLSGYSQYYLEVRVSISSGMPLSGYSQYYINYLKQTFPTSTFIPTSGWYATTLAAYPSHLVILETKTSDKPPLNCNCRSYFEWIVVGIKVYTVDLRTNLISLVTPGPFFNSFHLVSQQPGQFTPGFNNNNNNNQNNNTTAIMQRAENAINNTRSSLHSVGPHLSQNLGNNETGGTQATMVPYTSQYFNMSYPSDWTAPAVASANSVSFTAPNDNSNLSPPTLSATADYYAQQPGTTLQTYTDNRLSILENNHYYNVISGQNASLSGLPAHQITYGSACNGTSCTFTNYEIFTVQSGVDHPIVYTITYTGNSQNYNDYLDKVNQMVGSFTINSPNNPPTTATPQQETVGCGAGTDNSTCAPQQEAGATASNSTQACLDNPHCRSNNLPSHDKFKQTVIPSLHF